MCGEYLLPPLSKVRAVCGSTACTDLRGGRRVIGVPTATTKRACLNFRPLTFPVTRLQCATSTANSRKAEEVHNCSTDEGRPLGTGLQEQVPNHLRRLCPKGKVVNAEGKGLELPGQVTGKKRTAREPPMKCRNVIEDVQNRSLVTTVGEAPTIPAYGRSGIRHERWPELAMRQLNGTWEPLRHERENNRV